VELSCGLTLSVVACSCAAAFKVNRRQQIIMIPFIFFCFELVAKIWLFDETTKYKGEKDRFWSKYSLNR
jgi:hypothetical protein